MELNGNSTQSPHVSDEVLDARYFKALDRFDIRFARTMWVFDNVRADSDVLHLGCGAGMLALLKRKRVTLSGVDASAECALAARRNGYDATFQTELFVLPFADGSFDYIVSLDALNLLTEDEQQSALAETKRVLRPGGVMLHVVEGAAAKHETARVSHFLKFFQHIAYQPRYALCSGTETLLETADNDDYEADFLEYVRGLSFKERRAFDIAVGYVFNKVSELGVAEPDSGRFILLKASDAPLGPFYNEHRDRRALFSSDWMGATGDGLCLDRDGGAIFDDGWYEAAMLPPVARWMGRQARIQFRARAVNAISFDLIPRLTNLGTKPLLLEVLLNGVRLSAFAVCKYGWLETKILVPENLSEGSNGAFELEIKADRTDRSSTEDRREISIAVCNIQIRG